MPKKKGGEAVKVMVRARPMNKREKKLNSKSVIDVREKQREITITDPQGAENKKTFTYDAVFDEDSRQDQVYETSAFGIVQNMFEGYNGTIFAYGQTGCGKTFSMMGVPSDEKLKGIIPRSFKHIVSIIQDTKDKNFLLRCSFIEIYNENIHDLLGKDTSKNMDLRESKKKGIFIKGLNLPVVKTVDDMLKWMNKGDKERHVGATAMNQDSSRSHSIFTVYLEVEEKLDAKNSKIKAGKLNLVDLAGSERQSKTEATGQRLKEATKINLSLSALGNVIAALVSGKKKHIPYRDSKLTRLLQDSLGGNTKTLMIAAISPADDNYDETLGTLKYANRAKQIKNKPKINEDPKDAMIREYQQELERLKAMLGKDGGKAPLKRMKTEDKEKLSEMERMHDEFHNNHKDLQDNLNEQEKLIEEERRKREEMEKKLKEMQENMVHGGDNLGVTKEDKEDLNRMEQHNIEREKEDKKLMKEKATDPFEEVTDNIEEMKDKYNELQKRYKQVTRDVRDQEYENAKEKADILETLRYQERELDFLRQITKMIVSGSELDKIRQHSRWDEDEDDYVIPNFGFKDHKDIKNLPTLNLGDNLRGGPAVSPHFPTKDNSTTQKSFRVSKPSKAGNSRYNGRASKDVFDSFEESSDNINFNRLKTGHSRNNGDPTRYVSTSANINKMRKTQRMNGTMTSKRVRPSGGKLAPISFNKNIFQDSSVIEDRERSFNESRNMKKRPRKHGRLKPMKNL